MREICSMINLSFSSGVFPDFLKIATIIPIFKKGNISDIGNYRPISILPFIGKIFEKSLYIRLVDFLSKNGILSESQFGFRPGVSTTDAISNLVEHLYENLNLSLNSINIFIDFSRAFDTVDRGILFKKLEAYGIRGVPLKLITDYFKNRKQFVRINTAKSNLKTTEIGIGQGNILGPLWFILYINDLPNISNKFKTVLYADDSTLTFKGVSLSELIYLCNTELEKLFEWTKANRLTLNTGKTFFSLVTNNRVNSDFQFNISINGVEIERKNSLLFLGINLDEKLKFQNHISYVCAKVSRSVGILYKLSSYVPFSVLKSVYYAFVYPYLFYSNLVWGGTFFSHLQPLIVLQKKIIRIINNACYHQHTNPLFYQNRILKLQDIHFFTLAVFMFKNQNSPIFYHPHLQNTRNRELPRPVFQRLTLTQRSVFFKGLTVWNSLPILRKLNFGAHASSTYEPLQPSPSNEYSVIYLRTLEPI